MDRLFMFEIFLVFLNIILLIGLGFEYLGISLIQQRDNYYINATDGDYYIDGYEFHLRANDDSFKRLEAQAWTNGNGSIWIKTTYANSTVPVDSWIIEKSCNHEYFHTISSLKNLTLEEELAGNIEQTLRSPICSKLMEVIK